VIACALSFHIWVRSKSIQVGYQNQQLTSQEVDLLNDQRQLVLEEQTIKDPKALEIAALGELNMIIPAADRIIMPTPPQEQNMGNSEALALGNLAEASGTNVPSAFN
ncbi:MAG: cell division protein FtsL, partial [Acidobacteriota bacterium]